ncbi:MAG: glycogen debranching protein GlgX [Candidatus Krumholzibacteriota bacterium]
MNQANPRTPPMGMPAPLGATVLPGGVNFAVFSKYAEGVQLLLFAHPGDAAPARVIDLDPDANRTDYYWHVLVPRVGPGQVYAWRIRGPRQPESGHLFDGEKVLLDPYGLAVTGQGIYDRQTARRPGDNCAHALRSVVVDPAAYDWEGDRPLPPPAGREIIYEMHVGAFTAHRSSGLAADLRGTYAGLIEKIGHLQELGVTTVELLPVHHFDPQDAPAGKTNYWGYSSVSWFAPHAPFSSDKSPTGPVDEFRDMVKALHRAGIRVILDVVYNHTAEGEPDGPVISWRGFENSAYYMLEKDRSLYADYTGCGNTVNANHSVVRRMILDSLRHWVQHMHVDGFRFDLAASLARGEDGKALDKPPLIWAIQSDPRLAGTRMIAEAWDAGGLNLVESFPGERFDIWNGPFRDSVRRFLRGDKDTIETLMASIVGSPDLFASPRHRPFQSINFVTCHDGFSLRDLVSYRKKHNEANGEMGQDGSDGNLSCNHGIEGPTDDPAIIALRERQVRNFLCLLLLSHGTPMLLMGDEGGHTRQGNNNPWCQDNELNWLDWDQVRENAGLVRFTRELVRFTKSLEILQENRFWTATSPDLKGEISWHGTQPGRPDWTPASRVLAFTLEQPASGRHVHVMLNAGNKVAEFTPPNAPAGLAWTPILDTSRISPDDIGELTPQRLPATSSVMVPGHSIRVLQCKDKLLK